MKKIISILTSVMLVVIMALPVFAEGFTPSITAKPAPEVVGGEGDIIGIVIDENGNKIADIHTGDIVITGITDKDQLSDEARAELEKALAELKDGTADLPQALKDLLGENPVAKDLFDVTAVAKDIIDYLAEGNSIQFTLDADVAEGALVGVASYVNGEWLAALEVINNGDGTITVVLPAICPVGIFVEGEPVAPEATPEASEPVEGEPAEGDCKICHTFFPYLGAAPLFHGVCIICFILIILAVCVASYIFYRIMKKEDKKDK